MKLPRLTINQKLAAVALLLGAVALLSQPHRGPFVKLDTRELASVVEEARGQTVRILGGGAMA